MDYSVKPSGQRVLLKKAELAARTGQMVRLDTTQDGPLTCEVVAVGPGKKSAFTGEFLTVQHKVGQLVSIPPTGGWKIRIQGEEFIVIEDELILCVIEKL